MKRNALQQITRELSQHSQQMPPKSGPTNPFLKLADLRSPRMTRIRSQQFTGCIGMSTGIRHQDSKTR